MGQPRIAFVSREVYPFDSAGLGNYVTFSAAVLAAHAEVTIFTSDVYEKRYYELVAARDPRLPKNVRFEFIREPEGADAGSWFGVVHLWGARALEALARVYPDGGPDLAEFPDYLGEGFVAAQAAYTHDPRLRHTKVCLRAYTTSEMCAVLDGFTPPDRESQLIFELERYALRYADRFIWPGGDVLSSYRRFYGSGAVTEAVEIPHAVVPNGAPATGPAPGDGQLRLLYIGRLERRKGVQNLIRAVRSLATPDWSLTMVGGDTPTAPMGMSMRDQLELMVDDDPRIRMLGRVPRASLQEHFAEADACISPSLWECWPNTVLEAFEHDRPVIATPVGGHVGMVDDGVSGWLAEETSPDALADVIERAAAARARGAWPAGGAARQRFEQLTDPTSVVERYLELAAPPSPRAQARSASSPLVSVVVAYFRMHEFVEETLASVREQTHPNIEVILVNDGSLGSEDAILEPLAERYECRLVTQPNSGLGQARNLGIDLARGRYILPLDPDDMLRPTYVERCVDILERRPDVAYVTAWSTYIREDGNWLPGGYRPIGNTSGYIDTENVAGSAMSVFRREPFDAGLRYSPDLTSYEDWLLLRQLRSQGLYGHVIPEALLLYRVRGGSMLRELTKKRERRLTGELDAHLKETEVEWVASA
jgi:glycosyltransferase involved in cell wall biosynthesis